MGCISFSSRITMGEMAKPTLILIHGFRGTHHGLSLIADKLDEFNCIIPDLPGFAEGPALPVYTLESYVEWLYDFIQAHHKHGKPHLLGHSFGSIICAAYAARYPETIETLSLINPIGSPALEGPRSALSKVAVLYYWLGKKLPRPLAHSWLSSKPSVLVMSNVMAKTKDKQLRRYIHDQHLRYFSQFHSPSSVYESFLTSIQHTVRDAAPEIFVRTLLVAGEQDDITPIEKQRELVTLFSDATLVTIPEVGHLTHYETPTEVAEAVQAFIKSE